MKLRIIHDSRHGYRLQIKTSVFRWESFGTYSTLEDAKTSIPWAIGIAKGPVTVHEEDVPDD